MKRLLLAIALLTGLAQAQTTSITGTIRDLTNSVVTSGQISFTLQPGIDTTMSGTARFTPFEVDCTITGAGLVKALDGVSTCTLTNNTSLQPAGTAYKACIQPGFISPGSCVVFYALGSSIDISTLVPTPAQMPAYHVVDDFSNQSIAGTKTFTGTVILGGSLGATTFSGNLTVTGDYINCATCTMKWGSSGTSSPDLGLSRSAANTLACGTGAQGNAGCTFLASKIAAGGAAATGSVAGDTTAARSATSGAYFLGTDGAGQLFRNGDSVSLSGTTKTWSFPATTGNVVIDSATQTLTQKTVGAGGLAGLTPTFQTFTASGTQTIATGITAEKCTIVGGGGAGGGATAANNGGGGGAGGVAIKWFTGLTPGNTLTITVGSGGTGVSTATGNAGTASSISSGTQVVTTVTANGGNGGFTVGAISPGGAGATVSTNGDINGAGNAGNTSYGGNVGGGGGPTFLGGSGNPASGGAGNTAVANTGSGGGGAGAGGNAAGGNGAAGIVICEWVK
jgi:hypothetical protein